MKVWEKNYLYTLTLFIIVFFTCIFVIVHTSFQTALSAERETAIHDEYFIARAIATDISALENRNKANFETISNVTQPYGEYYQRNGIQLSLSSDNNVYYGSARFVDDFDNAMVCKIITANTSKYVQITDALQGTNNVYFLTYRKNINDIYQAQTKRTMFLIILSVCVSVLLAIGLYITLHRLYRPISNLAHELRTPLTAIQGYAEYLSIAAASEEERYSATKYIINESRRLSDITDKLLIMANLRDGKILYEKVDIKEVFENAKMTFGHVEYSISQKIFKGDKTLLQSMVNNLISNAIKASSDDQRVVLRAYDNTIEVIDSGKGIDASEIARLNKPSARYPSKDGSGLGIAICHQIAHLHSAHLAFESKRDNGTTARVIFTKP